MRYPLQGRRVLVVGMGKSGMAAVELLREHGAIVSAADEAAADRQSSCRRPKMTFTNADLIVLSPGVPIDLPPSSRRVAEASRSSAKSNWPAIFFVARSAVSRARTARPPPPR